jgi:hypothetical protein
MSELTPEDIERMIEDAGSSEVFARARALGWTDGHAPLWVWASICSDIKRGVPLLVAAPARPQSLSEAVLGFRL